MATELLLAPRSWFPPFGNKLVEMSSGQLFPCGVLGQGMLGFALTPKPLPWIPHTSLHRTSSQVVWPSLGGPRGGLGSTRSSLGSSPSVGELHHDLTGQGLGHLPRKLLCPVFTSLARLVLFPPLTHTRSSEEQFPPFGGNGLSFPVVQPSLVMSGSGTYFSQALVQHHESSCWLVSFQVCTHNSVSLKSESWCVSEIRIM